MIIQLFLLVSCSLEGFIVQLEFLERSGVIGVGGRLLLHLPLVCRFFLLGPSVSFRHHFPCGFHCWCAIQECIRASPRTVLTRASNAYVPTYNASHADVPRESCAWG
ncbi:uncharacterized protein TM35_000431600 [Trypanosoma theileri]|uniref:Secreted protein n=1 Tax=Trypanosoma theileri TaxID=67003 RepID=A0A1X0NIM1_9TRYP|nr:uncharacterized protein TM35_000431600 [Trypanosoma theileri]ORC84592.1 hypothetical protein TM35_000431600 [Trypanosoma theileri]